MLDPYNFANSDGYGSQFYSNPFYCHNDEFKRWSHNAAHSDDGKYRELPNDLNLQKNKLKQVNFKFRKDKATETVKLHEKNQKNISWNFDPKEAESHVMLNKGKRERGTIKFFNQLQQFGFIIPESGSSNIFFHFDDLKDSEVPPKLLRRAEKDLLFWVTYQIQTYMGKHDLSFKATNIKIESIHQKLHTKA